MAIHSMPWLLNLLDQQPLGPPSGLTCYHAPPPTQNKNKLLLQNDVTATQDHSSKVEIGVCRSGLFPTINAVINMQKAYGDFVWTPVRLRSAPPLQGNQLKNYFPVLIFIINRYLLGLSEKHNIFSFDSTLIFFLLQYISSGKIKSCSCCFRY